MTFEKGNSFNYLQENHERQDNEETMTSLCPLQIFSTVSVMTKENVLKDSIGSPE